MKHIKLYEELDLKIGKYIISKFITNLVISEVINISHSSITIKELYTYNKNSQILKKSVGEIFQFHWEEIKDTICYDSDNLQHILDIIPTIFDAKKYNL